MGKGSNKHPQKIPAQHPRLQVNHVKASAFSGPLPPPDIMEGYNIELHQDELMADWHLASTGQTPFKIEPLR
jgi:uncharacterized membrane protein